MLEFEIVVPAYNEAENLELVVENAISSARKHGFSSQNFKLVLVNNGSTDNSSKVIDSLLKSDSKEWLKPVLIANNQGYGYGIWAGLQQTKAEYVAWTHADLQCDIENAFIALSKIKSSRNPNRLIKGSRSGRDYKDIFVTRVFELLAKVILGQKVNEINAQPKVFHRSLLRYIKNPPYDFAFDLYVLYKAKKFGYLISSIPVLFPPRIHGVSKWASNFFSRYKMILSMIKFMINLRKSEGNLISNNKVHKKA